MSSNPVVPFQSRTGTDKSATDAKAAKDYASAAADRQKRQFEWARSVLEQLGLADRIKNASSFDELRKIVFDADAVGVTQAIQDKQHPASGPKDPDFIGFKEGALKKLLRNQFDDMKKDREGELKKSKSRGGASARSSYDWTSELKLDAKGGVRPLLANCPTIKSCHSDQASQYSIKRGACDLSPFFHPAMRRVLASFEP